jgi:hypothetical protein
VAQWGRRIRSRTSRIGRGWLIAAPVAGALLLAGCGPFGPSPASSPAPAAAPTTTTSPPSTTATTSPPAHQAVISGSQVGFSNPVWWETSAGMASDFNTIQSTGAKWVRFDFDWSGVQAGGPSSWNWSAIDQGVNAARSRGLNVLAVADYTPTWARGAGTDDKYPPTNPNNFATFLRAAVTRYAPLGVHAWEIWNEPNNAAFWKPNPDVAAYTALLKVSYTAVKAVDPSSTVMTGGTAPAGGSDAPLAWLQGIYDNAGKGSFDAVAHHPYTGMPYGPSTVASWNAFRQTLDLRNLMVNQGDDAKKIWGTEAGAWTGTSTNAVSESQQADFVNQYLQGWASWSSFTGPFFYYAPRDMGTDPSYNEDNFGLVHNDGSPKPGLTTFRNDVG